MKTHVFAALLFALFFPVSCGGIFPPGDSRYVLELPRLPCAWGAMLGEPHWRVEWFDGEGRKCSAVLSGAGVWEVSMPGTFANPVLALPFWPEKGIAPGVFRPAGAMFPFDVSGNRLILSWRGGVDANLFLELARSVNDLANGGLPATGNVDVRLPWNFNWPRFRRLFEDPAQSATLNAEVRCDPWLVNWPDVAARTVRSGFDRRRLVPESRTALEFPAGVGPGSGSGPWVGTSPFAEPLVFDQAPVFPVRAAADTWVSAGGLLRANTDAWMWVEFPAEGEGR